MDFEDNEMGNENDVNGTPPPEEASNRTFILVAGALGAIMLLTLVALALYAFIFAPRGRTQRATQVAEINAQNTQVARAAQQTAAAAQFTATPTATLLPTNTLTPTSSPTPVVVVPTVVQATATQDFRTATVAALLTQAAAAQQTVTPTASGLPQTGFAEDVGVPGLVGLTLVLVVVIFLARRLRTSGT
jgi:LPXTG-motif cell wall-anchored protein